MDVVRISIFLSCHLVPGCWSLQTYNPADLYQTTSVVVCVEFVVGSKNGHILLDPRSVEIDKSAGRWRLKINFGSIKNSRLYTIIYIIDISEAIILISYIYSGHFVLFLLLCPSWFWWWWGAAAVAHQNRCPFFWGCRGTRWQHCPSFIYNNNIIDGGELVGLPGKMITRFC